MFKKELLKFIIPEPNSTYNIKDTKGLKLLTKLRLGLSHLGEHKFRHNFQDCISYVLLWSGYWNKNALPTSLPQSSLFKENPLSQDKSSTQNHLKTKWFNKCKDFAIRWQKTRFWNKQNFTDVCNRVYFISREIQLSLIRVKPNHSIVSLYSYTNETFMF